MCFNDTNKHDQLRKSKTVLRKIITFREKIDKLLKVNTLGINTVYGLEKHSGASVGSIRKYYESDTDAGLRTIKKIWDSLGVNQTWWETGKGEIFTEKSTQVQESPVKYEAIPNDREVVGVRLVEAKAHAGYLRGYADPEYMESLPQVFVTPESVRGGNFLCFTVNGDSMDDGSRKSICHGDVVLGRELSRHHWQNKLHFKNVLFIIIHPTEGICFKEIISHNTESGEIICHSWNNQYEDFALNLRDVKQLFYMKKIVERNINF